MSKLFKALPAVLLVILFGGCSTFLYLDTAIQDMKPIFETIEPDAVYWHEGSKYSYKIFDGSQIITKSFYAHKVYSTSSPTYIEHRYRLKEDGNIAEGHDHENNNWILYLNSLDELGTAGWNHGKFGSGTTTRID